MTNKSIEGLQQLFVQPNRAVCVADKLKGQGGIHSTLASRA